MIVSICLNVLWHLKEFCTSFECDSSRNWRFWRVKKFCCHSLVGSVVQPNPSAWVQFSYIFLKSFFFSSCSWFFFLLIIKSNQILTLHRQNNATHQYSCRYLNIEWEKKTQIQSVKVAFMQIQLQPQIKSFTASLNLLSVSSVCAVTRSGLCLSVHPACDSFLWWLVKRHGNARSITQESKEELWAREANNFKPSDKTVIKIIACSSSCDLTRSCDWSVGFEQTSSNNNHFPASGWHSLHLSSL